jgi:hypothetical protein
MLTYRDTEFLKSEIQIEKTLESGLKANQLGWALHLKEMQVLSEGNCSQGTKSLRSLR